MGNVTEMNGSRRDGTLPPAIGWVHHRRHIISIVLACLAIALEIYYSICAGSCSYLQGSIFGMNLQYVGIAYMACIILLGILRKDTLLFVLISAGVGIEFYLIGFQVWYSTYCPYCLGFAAIVFILFLLNFQRGRIFLAIVTIVLALAVFSIFFKGSVIPTYSYTLHTNPMERFLC